MYEHTYSCTIVLTSGIREVDLEQTENVGLDIGDQPGEELDSPVDSWKCRIEKVRQAHPLAFQRWTTEDDDELKRQFSAGESIDDLARTFQRTSRAIILRLHKLGCLHEIPQNGLF
jgi:hypothetical protein